MTGFSKQRPYHGVKEWQGIVRDCSRCTHVEDDLFKVCYVHSFVLKKLRELAFGVPARFCYCIQCDEVVCQGMPASACQFLSDQHDHGFEPTIINEQQNLETALAEFRGGVP